MAITMVKKGELPGEKWYIGRCLSCMSEYRAQRKDLHHVSTQRDGDEYTHECQLTGCNRLVYFKKEDK